MAGLMKGMASDAPSVLVEEPKVRASGPPPPEDSVHVLHVALRDSDPPIWRRLEVPSSISLAALHTVLQVAIGWENEHLHMFRRKRRGEPTIDSDSIDEHQTQLWMWAPKARSTLSYIYDFGDDWVHDIKVERVYVAKEPLAGPRCVEGDRAGPPEDCGGVHGLANLMMRDASGEEEDAEDDDYDDWARFDYDPHSFSVEAVNRRLTQIFKPRKQRRSASRRG